jgi:hypothetical protein
MPNNNQIIDAALEPLLPNSILEVKLEILHACLTHEGRNNVEWTDTKIKLKEEEKITFIHEIGSTGKTEFDELKSIINTDSEENYFKKLITLRDTLLSDY